MVLIGRYGEIFLKGKNRLNFEKRLVENIKQMFGVGVLRKRNRILVNDDVNLKRIFGLISFSPAVEVDLRMEKIKEIVLDLVKKEKFESFAVSTKRMSTNFEFNSQQVNELIGEFVLENFDKKVDLSHPDLTIGIEMIDNRAYIFTKTFDCFGGLPVGVEGKVGLLIEDGGSILAGLLMMKRGCDLVVFSYEDTGLDLLQKYSSKKLELKKIQEKELLNEFLIKEKCLALVTGEKEEFKDWNIDLPVLKPLVAYDQKEIEKMLTKFENE
ncbi:THUMP domain-containing protein [Nanoarchaeota archaeon]